MNYEFLKVCWEERSVTAGIHRPGARNALNGALLRELNQVLDEAEQRAACRVVVIEGEGDVFCTGMDFHEMFHPDASTNAARAEELDSLYLSTLRRFSLSSRVIIAHVNGQALAGGVGLVAASDIAIATRRAQFSLSEALWGLLPACVTPYLIRRVGFQKAFFMTLTTQTLSAEEALAIDLVDQVSDAPADAIRKYLIRLCRLDEITVRDMKRYFRKMWLIDTEMEKAAVAEITRLVLDPRVRENIGNFVEHRRFPWERAE